MEILHADADGDDTERACLDSCYECLRTFRNQWHHDKLNRTLVIGLLLGGVNGATFTSTPVGPDWDALLDRYDSETEKEMVLALREAGIPAPTDSHVKVIGTGDTWAEADLLYSGHGLNLAVMLDGGVHDDPTNAKIDEHKRQSLKQAGYSVIVIRHDDIQGGIDRLKQKLRM